MTLWKSVSSDVTLWHGVHECGLLAKLGGGKAPPRLLQARGGFYTVFKVSSVPIS